MTTTTQIKLETEAAQTEAGHFAVDSLDVRDAVIGDGLMLTQGDRQLTIHSVTGGRAELIGTYRSAGDALAALDAIDCAV